MENREFSAAYGFRIMLAGLMMIMYCFANFMGRLGTNLVITMMENWKMVLLTGLSVALVAVFPQILCAICWLVV